MVARAKDVPTIVLTLFIVTAVSILACYLFWKVSLSWQHQCIELLALYCAYLSKSVYALHLPLTDMHTQGAYHTNELFYHNTDVAMWWISIVFFFIRITEWRVSLIIHFLLSIHNTIIPSPPPTLLHSLSLLHS